MLSALALPLSGCGTLSYLLQAGKGQLALINRAKPIDEVIKDERTPPRVRKLLAEIPAIKHFSEESGLKPTKNYTDYVKLDRPVAVWVVSACEPLKFKSKEWGFPIVGRFPYLGWFDLDGGRKFAQKLKEEGWDVDLRGARAYSTLGWFRDAVLSSMIPEGPEALGELVNVVIHESVHATLYISGQAYFNESIANFVADRLTDVYLERHGGPEAPEKVAYDKDEKEGDVREVKLHEAYETLAKLYDSSAPDAEKLVRKKEILDKLKTDLGYKRDITNATLVQFKTYNTGKDEFEAVYKACGGKWDRFWATMRTLNGDSFGKSQQEDLAPVLNSLAQRGCPQS